MAAIVVEQRFRRQQPEPAGYEILLEIAASRRGLADALSAAADAEGLEHGSERLGGDGAFLIPGPIRLSVQPVEQGGGRDALGIAVVVEGLAQIVEKLQAVFAVVCDL